MEIIINTVLSIPLYTQLVDQIKKAVQSRKLKPGSALPSIRQLANDLNLNHNTVAKAYRILERDSVIITRGYRGTIIHPNAEENSTVDLRSWVINQLTDTIKVFRESGVTDSEIRNAFRDVMNNRNF